MAETKDTPVAIYTLAQPAVKAYTVNGNSVSPSPEFVMANSLSTSGIRTYTTSANTTPLSPDYIQSAQLSIQPRRPACPICIRAAEQTLFRLTDGKEGIDHSSKFYDDDGKRVAYTKHAWIADMHMRRDANDNPGLTGPDANKHLTTYNCKSPWIASTVVSYQALQKQIEDARQELAKLRAN